MCLSMAKLPPEIYCSIVDRSLFILRNADGRLQVLEEAAARLATHIWVSLVVTVLVFGLPDFWS
jgi:hypothetical protein